MGLFRYEARDRRGLIQKDQISAESLSAARAQLEADGYEIRLLEPVPETVAPVEKTEKTSNEKTPGEKATSDSYTDELQQIPAREAKQVAEQIASLTNAQLPVADGLRALAMDLSPSFFQRNSLRRSLVKVADQIDSGTPVATVLSSLPTASELSVVMTAGVQNGRAAEAVGEYTAHSNALRGLGWRTLITVTYPLLTFLFAMAGIVYLYVVIIPDAGKILQDFGIELNGLTLAVLATSRALTKVADELLSNPLFPALAILGVVGLGVAIWWFLRSAEGRKIVHRIPIMGRIFKWGAVAKFCHVLAILIKQNQSLHVALQECGTATADPDLAIGCLDLANQMESGVERPRLHRAVEGFPTGFLQLLSSNPNRDALAEALHATARMYEARIRVRASVIGFVLKPIVLVFGIAIPMLITAIGVFLPLVKLLGALT